MKTPLHLGSRLEEPNPSSFAARRMRSQSNRGVGKARSEFSNGIEAGTPVASKLQEASHGVVGSTTGHLVSGNTLHDHGAGSVVGAGLAQLPFGGEARGDVGPVLPTAAGLGPGLMPQGPPPAPLPG